MRIFLYIFVLALAMATFSTAQESYLFVDETSNTTNGPFRISPYTTVTLGEKTYTMVPADIPFEFEARRVPKVDFRESSPEDALRNAFAGAGLTNTHVGTVVFYPKSSITNRVTFLAMNATLGEIIAIVAELSDLTILRQRSSYYYQPKETIILRPRTLVADQTTEVFSMSNKIYDHLVKEHGSFARFLIAFGIIRTREQINYEYDRGTGLLILHAPRSVIQAFHNTI